MPCRRHHARLAALAVCLLAPSLASAAVTYETQYLSGQAVPSGALFDFSTFTNIGRGSINADGEIAFIADVNRLVQIDQPGVTRSEILSEGASALGNPAQVARVGDPVPNAPAGVTYLQFDSIQITNAGNVGFMGRRSDLPAIPGNDLAVPFGGESFFMTSPTAPANARLIATAADEPVAFLGGNTIKSIFPVTRFDDQGGFSGAFGLTSGLVGDSPPRVEVTSVGILAGDANGFTRQVPSDDFRNNFAAQNSGDTLLPVSATFYGFNDRGEHAFFAGIRREGLLNPVITVFSEAAGSIGNPQIVASTNDPIPEISQDALVSGFQGISVNNAGQHAYQVSYKSVIAGDPLGNGKAILSESRGTPGAPGLVYREGDRVSNLLSDPRFEPLTPFLSFNPFDSPRTQLGDGGPVVFLADTVAEDGTPAEKESFGGLWIRGPGAQDDVQPVHLLRNGSDQIGFLGGFGRFERSFLDIDINARGQVAFLVDFSDTEAGFGDNNPIGETIYATDLSGDAQVVARSGELFDVSDDPNAPPMPLTSARSTVSPSTALLTSASCCSTPRSPTAPRASSPPALTRSTASRVISTSTGWSTPRTTPPGETVSARGSMQPTTRPGSTTSAPRARQPRPTPCPSPPHACCSSPPAAGHACDRAEPRGAGRSNPPRANRCLSKMRSKPPSVVASPSPS